MCLQNYIFSLFRIKQCQNCVKSLIEEYIIPDDCSKTDHKIISRSAVAIENIIFNKLREKLILDPSLFSILKLVHFIDFLSKKIKKNVF